MEIVGPEECIDRDEIEAAAGKAIGGEVAVQVENLIAEAAVVEVEALVAEAAG